MAADFYHELGVPRGASADEIRRAYRKLAAALHPDKHPGDAKAEARFKQVNRAHQVLGDPELRARYDEFGEDGLREGFDPEVMRAHRRAANVRSRPRGRSSAEPFDAEPISGLGDLFGELLRHRNRRGADVASEVTVDFAAAIRGTTLKLRVQDGSDEVTVRIPAGAADGDKVRVKGHGAPSMGSGEPGDLLLIIRVRPHPHFERDGLDLRLDLPITPAEAYRGAKVPVPTPGGEVTLTVPAHAQSGQIVRLRGRGVERGKAQGDLYVRFLVRLPDGESAEVAGAIDALEQAMTTHPRRDLRL